jgi:Xaa-Pro aminopeptidase
MKTHLTTRWLVVACLLLVGTITVRAQSGITPEEYKQRRNLLMSKMEPNSVAILKARDVSVRSNDVNYLYHQDPNFHYLTGCDGPRSYLLLCPDEVQVDSATSAREMFFIRPKTRSAAGESLGLEGAKTQLDFTVTLEASDLLSFTRKVLAGKKTLYYFPSIPDVVYDPLMEKRSILSREVKIELQAAFPGLEIKNLYGPIAEMRSIKSPDELALLQKAIDATITAHVEAMKSCEPEMYEY